MPPSLPRTAPNPIRRSSTPTSSRPRDPGTARDRKPSMPIEVLMPALSPTMTEGKLAKWLIKEGDAVQGGDVIAEIETDKATMGVEAVDEGKVGRLLRAEEQTLESQSLRQIA